MCHPLAHALEMLIWKEEVSSFARTPRQASHGASLTSRRPGKWPVCAQHVHPVSLHSGASDLLCMCIIWFIAMVYYQVQQGQHHAQKMLDLLHVHGTSVSARNHLFSWDFLGGNMGTILKLLDSLWFCTCLQAERDFWDKVNRLLLHTPRVYLWENLFILFNPPEGTVSR